LQVIIAESIKTQNKLNLDLKRAKFLLKDSKVNTENSSIKSNLAQENLEMRVKLLVDTLT